MGNGFSLIDFGKFAKPANTLIEKISGALGMGFEPIQIKRIARAEAAAALIRTQAQIECAELQSRAIDRLVGEEVKKQKNIESIICGAAAQLNEGSKPEKMDDDWITTFFDKARLTSDRDMQELWARILAGEANVPGSYSKRTIVLIASLEKTDAECFEKLMNFRWKIVGIDEVIDEPLILEPELPIYKENGVGFSAVQHLAAIGLVSYHSFQMHRHHLVGEVRTAYFDDWITLNFPSKQNQLNVGNVVLTRSGRELSKVCVGTPVPGFVDFVIGCVMRQDIISYSELSFREYGSKVR